MKAWRTGAAVAAVLLTVCRLAGATGLLLPKDVDLPPLGIKSHRVAVTVRDGVARTHVTQVFFNSTKQRLEATYVFPLPADAALTDFAMLVGGKRQSGQLVEADKARQIYEGIVRRMRDPGLLEYIDGRLLRMRVFPIEPESTQTIEVSYAYPLSFESGLYRYTFPLRTGQKASRVLEDSTFSVEISSRRTLGNVYSPTHEVGVSRKGDGHAVAGFEEEGAMLDKDFVLYYTLTDADFGLNLLTFRREGEDGYFTLMLAPRAGLKDEDVLPKDICLVLDVSGSMMQQKRIVSARQAARFCLQALGPKDRFALIPFSTSVDPYAEGLLPATKENVEKAVGHVEGLEARGGTALCGALVKALQMAPEGDRPYMIVLLTDGKPTIGVTEPDEILTAVKDANGRGARVFTFGIAEKLDVPLLDAVAETTRGYSQYVAPGREIETEVSAFFRKVSYPVLSGLKLDFGKVKVRDVYPQELPDLFRGSQIVVFGRYAGDGEVAVQLDGLMRGERRKFAYDADFPKESADAEFIPHLWARRKIAYLLDEVRLHGESEELVQEVVRLSKEFGIATPYTSYLILESAEEYARHGITRGSGFGGAERVARDAAGGRALKAAPSAGPAVMGLAFSGAGEEARPAEELDRDALSDWRGAGREREGSDAVSVSEAIRLYKDASGEGKGRQNLSSAVVRRVGERTFVRVGGVYVDTAFEPEMELLKVKWGSEAYFALLRAVPRLKRVLALGEAVVITVRGKALVVGEEGAEAMAEKDIKAFFGD